MSSDQRETKRAALACRAERQRIVWRHFEGYGARRTRAFKACFEGLVDCQNAHILEH